METPSSLCNSKTRSKRTLAVSAKYSTLSSLLATMQCNPNLFTPSSILFESILFLAKFLLYLTFVLSLSRSRSLSSHSPLTLTLLSLSSSSPCLLSCLPLFHLSGLPHLAIIVSSNSCREEAWGNISSFYTL